MEDNRTFRWKSSTNLRKDDCNCNGAGVKLDDVRRGGGRREEGRAGGCLVLSTQEAVRRLFQQVRLCTAARSSFAHPAMESSCRAGKGNLKGKNDGRHD
jgi:hypothetical protein